MSSPSPQFPSPQFPAAHGKPPSSMSAALKVLARYLRPLRFKVGLLALLLLASIGLNLLLPRLIASFLDSAQARGSLQGLTRLALSYIGLAVGVQLLSAGATYIGADVGWAATNRLRVDLTRHLLSLDMSYHKERTPGELIERIDGDVTALSNFFSQFAVRVFGAALLLLGAVVMFFSERWWLGLAVSLFVALALTAMSRASRQGVEPTRLERAASAGLFGFIEERLSGLDDVRALGAGPHTLRRFLEVQRDFFWQAYRAWMGRVGVWQVSMVLFALGYAGVIAAAAGLYLAGAISIGTAFLFYQYMSLVEEPIDQLTQQLQDLQKAGASLIRVGELLGLGSGLREGQRDLPPGPLGLEFEGVGFRYQDADTGDADSGDSGAAGEDQGRGVVLEDLSFELRAGHTLGLLGRTGSGKTTLTRLVSRLYDPSSGEVRLGGVSVGELRLDSLRGAVAVVTQDVQLFQATVRQNLTFFDDRLPDDSVRSALAEVDLLGWLDSLPDGLETPLAAGSLSAGEAQLLAFARVLLQDPRVVILDEPSSRLDPATEARLTAAVGRLLAGRTAIVIAHRLDTVAGADDILVLGAGRRLEYGPREELARDPGSHYSRLLRSSRAERQEVLA